MDVETFGDGHDIAVTAFIEDGYTVQKPEQFAEYLLKLAWSVDDTKPDQGLILTVVPGADGDFNIADALADGGWVEPAKDPDPLVIFIAPDQLNSMDKLGTWPGPSPKLPAGTLAKR
ncbi:hypothetical protein [Leifsonia sp. Leaf264]|uniref:hypothetical protein n=1 Tax=Leifsonia sp. Leaf264 TaxID=1736314 RepID=UPI0012F8F0CD|nr:hypothetical protein [Leifsonia sp. Leaf264]